MAADPSPATSRLPVGLPALLAAILPGTLVWSWDALDSAVGLPVVALLFLVAWLAVGAPLLARTSARPQADALLAGLLVAAVMAYQLVRIAQAADSDLRYVPTLAALFLAFDAGAAALCGLAATRLQRGSGLPEGRPAARPGAATAGVAIAGGIVVLVASVPIVPWDGPFPYRLLAVVPVAVAGLLIGGGAWGLVRSRRPAA